MSGRVPLPPRRAGGPTGAGALVDVQPALVVAFVALLVGILTITPWMVGTYYDDGTYLVLAKSLATGQGYRYLNLPGTPVATHFPPAYPFLLALLWKLAPDFPANTAVFKLANAVLLAVVATAAYAFIRRVVRWPRWPSAAVALLGTLAPNVLFLSSALMSEMLFLALLIPALLLGERLVRREGAWTAALAVGVLLGAAQLVRSAGLPALGAVLLVLAVRRRWRDAAIVAGAALALVLPWAWWARAHGGALVPPLFSSYGSYGQWIGQAFETRGRGFLLGLVSHNLLADAMYFGNRFMPVAGRLPSQFAFGCFVLVAAAGAWHLRRRAPVTLLFLLAYAALLLSWAFGPDRFFYAIEPFVAVLVAAGGAWSWRMARTGAGRRRAAGIAVGLAVLVLCVGYARDTTDGVRERRWERTQRQLHEALLPAVTWVRKVTPDSAVVSTDADPLVYLYSGRRTVPVVTFRAEYYLHPVSPELQPYLRDTRTLLTTFRPDFAVVRGPATEIRAALKAALPGVPARAAVATRLPDGGVVLGLRWEPEPLGRPR